MNEQEKKRSKTTEETSTNEVMNREDIEGDVFVDESIEESEEITKEELTEEEQQIKTLQDENKELNDRFMRMAAEYENFRKRTAKEKLEMYNNSKAQTAVEFLKVADTLERAIHAEEEDNEHKKGLLMILEQFQDITKALDIQEIEAQGEKFNPDYHNAVSQVENSDFGENTVCQVYEKGYKLGERVLRHAVVVVANP